MNTPLPILYSFRRCPYAIRARLALLYASIAVELREVLLKDKPQSMLDLSPKGTVPVLVLPDGNIIDESIEIMHWAIAQNDSDNWYQPKPTLRTEIDLLISQNDNDFKPWLDKYKYADRHPELSMAFYRKKAEEFLLLLESLLTKNRYLLAEHVTLADMAIFPFIRQFAFVDKNWFDQSDYHKLKGWLEQHLSSAIFEAAMIKIAQWKINDSTVIFPPP